MSRATPRGRPDGLPLTSPNGADLQWIRTSVVSKFANPFIGCWMDIDTPLKMEEVDLCLASQKEKLHPPTSWNVMARLTSVQKRVRRRQHIQKIAWFVRNGFQEPLEVDVGIPSMNCYVLHKVQDGNHRLAAALYRSDRYQENPLLPLSVGGCVDFAIALGLWEDNETTLAAWAAARRRA